MVERDPYLFKKNYFDLTMNEDKKMYNYYILLT